MKTPLWLAILTAMSASANSPPPYPIIVQGHKSNIQVQIGYTLGTHRLTATGLAGGLNADGTGEIRLPISKLKEGSAKLECHLQEALGLNYDESEFPESHVCDDKHALPDSGPNSVKHPDIILSVSKTKKLGETEAEISGKWTIHGVAKPFESLKVMLEKRDGETVAKGKAKFKLADYGIVVKKAFVISVADEAEVSFEVPFQVGAGVSR